MTEPRAPGSPPPPPPPAEEVPRLPRSWGRYRPNFRNRIFAGLIFIVPLTMTFIVGRWLYLTIYGYSPKWLQQLSQGQGLPSWSRPLIDFSEFVVMLLIIGLLLWIIGSLSSTYLTGLILRTIEKIVFSIPFVRSVYTFSKQVMDLIARNREEGTPKRVVLVEFPHEGFYAIAFASGATKIGPGGQRYVSVFLPTTPNPTSGYMLLYPEHRVLATELNFEEGIRAIISGGIVIPSEIGARPISQTGGGTGHA